MCSSGADAPESEVGEAVTCSRRYASALAAERDERRPTLGRVRRKVAAGALLVAALAAGGCGDPDEGTGQERTDGPAVDRVAGAVAARAEPVAGPALLPPLDGELRDGWNLRLATAPDEIDPALVAQLQQHPNGEIALYGDPSLADPFDGAWALAVVVQGSETSGLGGEYDAHGTEVRWIDVPVEQQSQELRAAGLLLGGMDDAAGDALAAGLQVSGGVGGLAGGPDDDRPQRVEIDAAALAASGGGLERLTAAAISGWEIGADDPGSPIAPSATWTRGEAADRASLSVTSFRADPAWELLLRAVNGGASVGRKLLPVGGEGAKGQSAGVATIGDTTVLVQTQGAAPPIAQVIDSLGPAGPEQWEELAARFPVQPPGSIIGDPDVRITGTVAGSAYSYALAVDTRDTPFGPSTTCRDDLQVAHRDGTWDAGGFSQGEPCGTTGWIGVMNLQSGPTLVHGSLPAEVGRVRLTLDGGQVVEPELQGGPLRAFVAAFDSTRLVVQAESFDASGNLLASFPDGLDELGSLSGVAAQPAVALQER